MAFLQTAALLGSLAASAYAHGRVTGISVVGGKEYTGFINDYLYTDSPPDIVAWSAQNGDNGFVDPTTYTTGDIICHHDGAPGKIAASVAAGGKIELQWGTDAWPESHHGPVMDYLAKCAGDDCTTVDAGDLSFFKIDEKGLNDAASQNWASDDLIKDDFAWTVTVPEDIAPGQYVLRHEIIALHSAQDTNGAQNYPSASTSKLLAAVPLSPPVLSPLSCTLPATLVSPSASTTASPTTRSLVPLSTLAALPALLLPLVALPPALRRRRSSPAPLLPLPLLLTLPATPPPRLPLPARLRPPRLPTSLPLSPLASPPSPVPLLLLLPAAPPPSP